MNAFEYSRVLDCEMNRFSATLIQMDAKHVAIERKKLTFEREEYVVEQ